MVEKKQQALPATKIYRSEDFLSVYANNIQFEASVWDLKILFGELDQSDGRIDVEQHTGVNLTWMQAKILAYYLRLNIAVHEMSNGKISVPDSVMPPILELNSIGWPDTPEAREIVHMLNRLREELFSTQRRGLPLP